MQLYKNDPTADWFNHCKETFEILGLKVVGEKLRACPSKIVHCQCSQMEIVLAGLRRLIQGLINTVLGKNLGLRWWLA